jgi:hypothetical protein
MILFSITNTLPTYKHIISGRDIQNWVSIKGTFECVCMKWSKVILGANINICHKSQKLRSIVFFSSEMGADVT